MISRKSYFFSWKELPLFCLMQNNKMSTMALFWMPPSGLMGSMQSCSRNAAGKGVFVLRNTKHSKFKSVFY